MASLTYSCSAIEKHSILPPKQHVTNPNYKHFTSLFSSNKSGLCSRPRTAVNVATPLKPAPPVPDLRREPLDKKKNGDHVAWTSVRQDRWEGELVVEGEIPHWLVCESILLLYIIITTFVIGWSLVL